MSRAHRGADSVGVCCQNVLVLAEAGCLDPRIFCTSCMVRFEHRTFNAVPIDTNGVNLLLFLCAQTKKPMRTNHCFSCDACVAKQDHHSVWTNSCIGE